MSRALQYALLSEILAWSWLKQCKIFERFTLLDWQLKDRESHMAQTTTLVQKTPDMKDKIQLSHKDTNIYLYNLAPTIIIRDENFN